MADLHSTFFDLFGIAQTFPLDLADLSARYRELQRNVHPDRFATGSDAERRYAAQLTARVNEAFEVLKSPMLRARYLLSLHGVEMDERGEATQDGAFLMAQMDMRETLEEVPAQADPFAALDQLRARIQQQVDALVAGLESHFASATPDALQAARENVRKLQFLNRLLFEIEQQEMALDA
jgi:molecular chaperone HscB